MTAEEIYKEFLEVTHINEAFIKEYYKITSLKVAGNIIASGFEGIAVILKINTDECITYFHNEKER